MSQPSDSKNNTANGAISKLKKPLSYTFLGKFLAVLAGIPSGWIGMILSPLAMMLVNKISKQGKPSYGLWILIGALCFFPIHFIYIIDLCEKDPQWCEKTFEGYPD